VIRPPRPAERDARIVVAAVAGNPPTVEAALAGADILVFSANEGDVVDAPHVVRLADAARERGILVAATVVAPDDVPPAPLLAGLRSAVDVVMLVRDASTVPAVLAALA
jgi:hypothetical protein